MAKLNLRSQIKYALNNFKGIVFKSSNFWELTQSFILFYKKRHETKVFCVGYHRTGTTTISYCLSILGYRSVHWFRNGIEPSVGWIEMIRKSRFDAFSDAPFFEKDFFIKIDESFHGSKFILTVRDTPSWKRSLFDFFKGTEWEVKDEYELKNRADAYEEHNKSVIMYFRDRPEDLLVMNIFKGDEWQKLCGFLKKPTPGKTLPHKNSFPMRNHW